MIPLGYDFRLKSKLLLHNFTSNVNRSFARVDDVGKLSAKLRSRTQQKIFAGSEGKMCQGALNFLGMVADNEKFIFYRKKVSAPFFNPSLFTFLTGDGKFSLRTECRSCPETSMNFFTFNPSNRPKNFWENICLHRKCFSSKSSVRFAMTSSVETHSAWSQNWIDRKPVKSEEKKFYSF